MKPLEHVFVGGVKVAAISRAELTRSIIDDCLERRQKGDPGPPRLLFDSNGHGISLAARDADFRRALEAADVIHADGGSVVLASRFLAGAPVPDRSATTDMIHDVIRSGLPHGIRHFFLGSTEEVNRECAERLAELHPGVSICGRHHGYFRSTDEDALIAAVNAAEPDVLWVGLGKPREQLFAQANKGKLRASWAITCGGCFNYITGDYRRAPGWMQANHLEWLFRAVTTPKLIWRYVTTSPHAIWLALTRIDRRRLEGEPVP